MIDDLSDEAFDEWANGKDRLRVKAIEIWREAVRRARANPWQLFSDEHLKAMLYWLTPAPEGGHGWDLGIEIEAELERRKSDGREKVASPE